MPNENLYYSGRNGLYNHYHGIQINPKKTHKFACSRLCVGSHKADIIF